ncbi:hypothetical protein [Streptomyces sp. NPDC056628]|uniref:hypothetical protein n=1 Tax=Streptomyces sp. NPDC056628 TaxID=3345882 RepID=UPI0036BC842E
MVSEDFVYDEVGNLTKTRGFSYTYDAAGQMLTRKYSDGNTITYGYDNDGRTSTMAPTGAPPPTPGTRRTTSPSRHYPTPRRKTAPTTGPAA